MSNAIPEGEDRPVPHDAHPVEHRFGDKRPDLSGYECIKHVGWLVRDDAPVSSGRSILSLLGTSLGAAQLNHSGIWIDTDTPAQHRCTLCDEMTATTVVAVARLGGRWRTGWVCTLCGRNAWGLKLRKRTRLHVQPLYWLSAVVMMLAVAVVITVGVAAMKLLDAVAWLKWRVGHGDE